MHTTEATEAADVAELDDLAKAGRHDRNDVDERGVPEGRALKAIALGQYDPATMREWWDNRKLLGPDRMLPGHNGSWNHGPGARACEYRLGLSDGVYFITYGQDQTTGVTGLNGKEAGRPNYGSFPDGAMSQVILEADLRLQKNPADKQAEAVRAGATKALRHSLVFSALCAAPGSLGAGKADNLTSACTVQAFGERVQLKPFTNLSPQLALALGLQVDVTQIEHQPRCWPAFVFMRGAGATVFSAEERFALRRLVLQGDIAAVQAVPSLKQILGELRILRPLEIARFEGGGYAALLASRNCESVPTYVTTWTPRSYSSLAVDGDVRGAENIDPGDCTITDDHGVLTFTATTLPNGRSKSLTFDTRPLGRLLFRVIVPAMGPFEIRR
jgi:hypothetical protein